MCVREKDREKEERNGREKLRERSRGKVREREMKVANFLISMMMHVLNVRI